MDYMVELASHQNIEAALKLTLADRGSQSNDRDSSHLKHLLSAAFPRESQPHAWFIEIVHTFYAQPAIAAATWRNLRYCDHFCRQLAEHILRVKTSWHQGVLPVRLNEGWSSLTQPILNSVPSDYAAQFVTGCKETAIAAYANLLARDRAQVDTLCAQLQWWPQPPRFIGELVAQKREAGKPHDEQIFEWLSFDLEHVRDIALEAGVPVPFSVVLNEELEQIDATRKLKQRRSTDETRNREPLHPLRRAAQTNLLGLAFSGGGIRSATFNLGVLQALARIGLLKRCDYLSTVSGGGYIGAWFASWLRRESLGRLTADSIDEMQRRLSPTRSPLPMDPRQRAIRFLREYSNYLTPRTGFFSADTWTMLGIYIRNTLLNQVIVIALFAAVLMLPRNWFALLQAWSPQTSSALVAWAVGAGFLALNLNRLEPHPTPTLVTDSGSSAVADHSPPWWARPTFIQTLVVLPWWLGTAALTHAFGTRALAGEAFALGSRSYHPAVWMFGLTSLMLCFLLLAGRSHRCWRSADSQMRDSLRAFGAISLASLVAGVVAGCLGWAAIELFSMADRGCEQQWLVDGLGISVVLSILSLAIVAMLGMLGARFPDEHREWWSRLRTFIHVWAIGWATWILVSLYVPWAFDWLQHQSWGRETTLGAVGTWITATVLGVIKGRTAEDDQKPNTTTGVSPSASKRIQHYIMLIAPYVFVVGLFVALSLGIDAVFRAHAPTTETLQHGYVRGQTDYWIYATWTTHAGIMLVAVPGLPPGYGIPWTALGTGMLALIAYVFSRRVDVNEFSIHNFYKNRLVRCYLGASNRQRKADWFTGFDPRDDMRLKNFDSDGGQMPLYPGPYPIINCALNLAGGQDLAWQERKAASFVFTPKYCGYDLDRAVLTKADMTLHSEAFVPTSSYYEPGQGPLLGMAMAISGAAANPNMGRATSPALAFLMTVFNVRLGWWLVNPRRTEKKVRRSPPLGLAYTSLELFGGTDDAKKFVNVSDGGHFDNLGVYELVRRGCRYIILCDAGQDAELMCEDLGNVVRLCRTDFGVEIDIAVDQIRQRNSGFSKTHCVVGQIHYLNLPRRDDGGLVGEDGAPLLSGSKPAHEVGYLLYLKPTMTGDEPEDVLEYSRRIPEFPHQTTADQWFSESQFESYRRLGMHIGDEVFSRFQDEDEVGVQHVKQLFERLYRYWYAPAQIVDERATRHAHEYTNILEAVRANPTLRALDDVLFRQSLEQPAVPASRDSFYVCNRLLQLMENVYSDLDFEHNWRHPHVEGWMDIFRRWVRHPEVERTWRISQTTYAERFRNFYNDRLCGPGFAPAPSFIASFRGRTDPPPPHGANGDVSTTENTCTAFDAAIEARAQFIAITVRKYHQHLVVGDSRFSATSASGALRLDECLKHVHRRTRLLIELGHAEHVEPTLKLLDESHWSTKHYWLASAEPEVLRAISQLNRDICIGRLVEAGMLEHAIKDFVENGLSFLALRPSAFLSEDGTLIQSIFEQAQAARVPLVPWITDDAPYLDELMAKKAVAGVVTPEVRRAVAARERHDGYAAASAR